ncbi:MAG: DUF5107 domain-containing protein [Anaerolineae bacterium]|nr:MAG: DUF5107 domain-containing protein [Anaerolineae bacterium]
MENAPAVSELRIENWRMPATVLGQENPLPSLTGGPAPPRLEQLSELPKDVLKNTGYGHVRSILPYTVQDGYARDLQITNFRVAVLENEFLRATFLLEYGGRLWSLVHRPSGAELLAVNPVLQLANLAIRNAWFRGGVEWNIGTIGHSPLTCSSLFAARVEQSDGSPILRLYEWERLRKVPFQIDAYLLDDSPFLFLRTRIINPRDHEVPMYWWSNIAVPATESTRVVVPSDFAYAYDGLAGLRQIPVPRYDGVDFTYAANARYASDYFFHIPHNQRPWVAALDGEGSGLIHVSTRRMVGRKMWVWGTGPGGMNWQRYLSPGGQDYVEIQAGLSRTQFEHLRMPPGAHWEWLEAYGQLAVDPSVVHGPSWPRAKEAVEVELDRMMPEADLSAEFERGGEHIDRPPVELYHRGSGWGALERRRREASGEPPFDPAGLVFDDHSLGEEQLPWIALIERGSFPAAASEKAPSSFVVGDEWCSRLARLLEANQEDNWLAWLHMGVMRHADGNSGGAREAWERSLEIQRTPWVLRNLAVLAREEGRLDEAAEKYIAACCEAPGLLPLASECGQCLIESGRTREWLELLETFPAGVRESGRIRLLRAQAALAEGETKIAERFFEDKVVVADLREGENSLSDLWLAYHEQKLNDGGAAPAGISLRERARTEAPIPREIDFRLTGRASK